VRTDAPRERYEPVVRHLEDVYEALAGTFFQGVPMPPVDVLLFSKQEDFEGVAPGHLLGFLTLRARSFEEGCWCCRPTPTTPAPRNRPLPTSWPTDSCTRSTSGAALAARGLRRIHRRPGDPRQPGRLRRHTMVPATSTSRTHLARAPARLGTSDFFGAEARAVYMTAWMLVRQLLGNPRPGMMESLQRSSPVARWPRPRPPGPPR
jgi:hypothetical protein